MARTAVLLMAFGGPESTEQVHPFMTSLMGRSPAPAVLEKVVARYQAIGGGSPLTRIVRQQAAAMGRQLASEGFPVPVLTAFRYSAPSIGTVVGELASSGFERIVGVSTSPHHSRITTGAYLEELRVAASASQATAVAAGSYYAHPDFLDGIAQNALNARSAMSDPENTYYLFSAHGLPREYVERGDPYVEELHSTVAGLIPRLPAGPWQIAYQSKGLGKGEWLEPAVETVLEELAAHEHYQVLLIPAGFTTDHVETLFDIDIGIAGKARELGLEFRRSEALNDSPAFIRALCSVVRSHLD